MRAADLAYETSGKAVRGETSRSGRCVGPNRGSRSGRCVGPNRGWLVTGAPWQGLPGSQLPVTPCLLLSLLLSLLGLLPLLSLPISITAILCRLGCTEGHGVQEREGGVSQRGPLPGNRQAGHAVRARHSSSHTRGLRQRRSGDVHGRGGAPALTLAGCCRAAVVARRLQGRRQLGDGLLEGALAHDTEPKDGLLPPVCSGAREAGLGGWEAGWGWQAGAAQHQRTLRALLSMHAAGTRHGDSMPHRSQAPAPVMLPPSTSAWSSSSVVGNAARRAASLLCSARVTRLPPSPARRRARRCGQGR